MELCRSYPLIHLRFWMPLLCAACAGTSAYEKPVDDLHGYELSMVIDDLVLQMEQGDADQVAAANAKFQDACVRHKELIGREYYRCPGFQAEDEYLRMSMAQPKYAPDSASTEPCPAEEYVRSPQPPDWSVLHPEVRVAFGAGDRQLLFRLICPAAAWEIPEAEFALCLVSANGAAGLAVDLPSAERWCRSALNHGYALADEPLANVLLGFRPMPELGVEIIELLNRASDRGSANAAFLLAAIYGEGRFAAQDLVTARAWALVARDRGHQDAPQLLALIESQMAASANSQ